MNVALLGFGTVGRSVARILVGDSTPLRLTHVFNRDVSRKRVDWIPADVRWTDDINAVLQSDVDVVVEVIGGRDPAAAYVRGALEAGKSVVTANKQLIAHEGSALLALARAHRVQLGFEAAVAGGIPVIRALGEGLSGDRVLGVSGVLNGTCNYILTRMAAGGTPFETALEEAQLRGFAEADPTDDLEGYDARAKLCILARVGLRVEISPHQVVCRTIRRVRDVDFVYARHLRCTIRQVSRAERREDGSVVAWVAPALVPESSPIARVSGSQNIVLVSGHHGGETAFSGHGAGGGPTAVAIVSDLIAVCDRHASALPARFADVERPATVTDHFSAPQYLRFVVRDRPGIIADLARVLAEHGINIDAVVQEPGMSKQALPFVITLEACEPPALARALHAMEELDFNVEAPLAMPVLG